MPRKRARHASEVIDVVTTTGSDEDEDENGGDDGDGGASVRSLLCLFGGRDEMDVLIAEIDVRSPFHSCIIICVCVCWSCLFVYICVLEIIGNYL